MFASLASVDHESPAEHREATEMAAARATKHVRPREQKSAAKLPEAPLLQRINGAI